MLGRQKERYVLLMYDGGVMMMMIEVGKFVVCCVDLCSLRDPRS